MQVNIFSILFQYFKSFFKEENRCKNVLRFGHHERLSSVKMNGASVIIVVQEGEIPAKCVSVWSRITLPLSLSLR